jgi:2OG-Fe(II) oxygenase superfamily
MQNWIRTYEDAVPQSLCDEACALVDSQGRRFDGGYRNCLEAIVDPVRSEPMYQAFRAIIANTFERYKDDVGHKVYLGRLTHLEPPVIVKYEPDGTDGFETHADNWNAESALRQLSVILYLNDVPSGGETLFPTFDMAVTPARGRALVFPSFFLFPHCAKPPAAGPKYSSVIWLCLPPCAGWHYRMHPLAG